MSSQVAPFQSLLRRVSWSWSFLSLPPFFFVSFRTLCIYWIDAGAILPAIVFFYRLAAGRKTFLCLFVGHLDARTIATNKARGGTGNAGIVLLGAMDV